ncbi:hypothetical protein DFJ73DRAFT_762687 [Zopfochytrium polystomum]|nr:hypothetical protein DFJ73DRAFT_762687 [Zopfochytrium polystomum]
MKLAATPFALLVFALAMVSLAAVPARTGSVFQLQLFPFLSSWTQMAEISETNSGNFAVIAFFSGNASAEAIRKLSYLEIRADRPQYPTTPGILTLWGYCYTTSSRLFCLKFSMKDLLSYSFTLRPKPLVTYNGTYRYNEAGILSSLPQPVNPLAFLSTLFALCFLALTWILLTTTLILLLLPTTSTTPAASTTRALAVAAATATAAAAAALTLALVSTLAFAAVVRDQVVAAYGAAAAIAAPLPCLIAGALVLVAAAATAVIGATARVGSLARLPPPVSGANEVASAAATGAVEFVEEGDDDDARGGAKRAPGGTWRKQAPPLGWAYDAAAAEAEMTTAEAERAVVPTTASGDGDGSLLGGAVQTFGLSLDRSKEGGTDEGMLPRYAP